MSKILMIVYEESMPNVDQGRWLSFRDKDADTASNAIFSAEAKGALMAHFIIKDTHYWLRTDKYLYWTYSETEA